MDQLSLVRIVQVDPGLVDQLGRIAVTQTIISVATALLALAALGAGGYAIYLLATVRRMMLDAKHAIERFSPRTEPTLERARRVVDDVSGTVDEIRARIHEVSTTVEEFNDALRDVRLGAEKRVRELTAVLDVVREQAEELLLDSAATAKGIHATAEALRAPRPTTRGARPQPPPPLPEEALRTSHGQG
jgi:uncharacterized protein YoxC